jgi:hypothetical protein
MLRDRVAGKQRPPDPGVSPELVALIQDICPLEAPPRTAVQRPAVSRHRGASTAAAPVGTQAAGRHSVKASSSSSTLSAGQVSNRSTPAYFHFT